MQAVGNNTNSSRSAARIRRSSALAIAGLVFATSAGAASFSVNSTNDIRDAIAGDGVCATATGVCTLRAAVEEANALGGADTIVLPSGIYLITLGSGDDKAQRGDFDITDTLTILGAGQSATIIDGNAEDRVFDIQDGNRLDLSGVTIRNGDEGQGGGIRVEGSLIATDVTLANNAGNDGGGISVRKDDSSAALTRVSFIGNTANKGGGLHAKDDATVSIVDSLFSANSARKEGGGVYFDKGVRTIDSSLFENNVAEEGGGLFIKGGSGSVQITNVTISGNTASKEGGGIHKEGNIIAQLLNVTVNANTSPRGGGVRVKNSGLQLRNTIIANSLTGLDCDGPMTSLGNNLATDGSCQLTQAGDRPNTAPLLGPLQDNGGPTFTHELLDFSPARDTGADAVCPAVDQRGRPRPIDSNGDGTPTCDIGAYEADRPVPDFYLQKTVAVETDPYSAAVNPKAIPGAVIVYTITLDNAGPGAADQDSLILVEAIPRDTALVVTDYDALNPGPVAFNDGSPASGLAYSFISLASGADDIEFSDDGGISYGYLPVPGADGSDSSVTHFRVRPTGIARYTGAAPVADFQFKVTIQ